MCAYTYIRAAHAREARRRRPVTDDVSVACSCYLICACGSAVGGGGARACPPPRTPPARRGGPMRRGVGVGAREAVPPQEAGHGPRGHGDGHGVPPPPSFPSQPYIPVACRPKGDVCPCARKDTVSPHQPAGSAAPVDGGLSAHCHVAGTTPGISHVRPGPPRERERERDLVAFRVKTAQWWPLVGCHAACRPPP